MSDYISVLKCAREAELEIQTELEHIERLHRILKIPHRNAEYAANMADKLARLEAELNALIDRAVDRKRMALECLAALDGDERTVLYQYYILAKDWQKISNDLYICERQIYNIRKKALNKLEKRASCTSREECSEASL